MMLTCAIYHPEPPGTCTISRWEDPPSKLRIDQADPEIRVTDELLREAAVSPMPEVVYAEGFFRVEATNRTITYRVDPASYCEGCDSWAATLQRAKP